MRDREWRLSYSGVDQSFGPADAPIFHLSAPEISEPEFRTDDTDRPRQDGIAFGVDFTGSRTITFDLGVLADTEAQARALLAGLANAWRARAVRSGRGSMAELRVQHAGRERVIYGRPRRFAVSEEEIGEGFVAVAADFVTADDVFYGPADESGSVALVPAPSGGLITPLTTPLTTTAKSDRSTVISVGGELSAWPVITVYGPITTPVIEVVGRWRMTLSASIAAGDSVTVDTRPWARTILRAGGGSLAGALTRDSVRLARAALAPGSYEIALRGIDATGTASMRLAWRPVYVSL
ncbi:hypothetical protein GCM10010168_53220 [Actinoplanes ianthinogenes]|uniref:Minor tail protein n=1 Tax=Actinoplanes ianthinogenes TaxID=122358 RepID=A0ABM7LR37_9ACTN|nr:hypothetical protein [Actinoplanes ianthinogenes]BCJ41680.1 hypothetical protein Aiant_23370 [Actinoplanes ianthinogenes]GGR28451.1 hypothetical protein GCM10010168_53220 [Actinoplanes ianthinogenes]